MSTSTTRKTLLINLGISIIPWLLIISGWIGLKTNPFNQPDGLILIGNCLYGLMSLVAFPTYLHQWLQEGRETSSLVKGLTIFYGFWLLVLISLAVLTFEIIPFRLVPDWLVTMLYYI
ncbi:hypothetical protein [Levilactobacillus bambusae]|uniref:Uncharacterized protein n=1 Tax=Levilactobacillus bambusae TaxID=2024736 RepID=A0A2V1N2F3_9LACO|nr:hypothetical protein [Levilactobacillus bambusae]PWG00446.1 hypothetical protein DCM90_05845 [Levilactobacillus bambusae]